MQILNTTNNPSDLTSFLSLCQFMELITKLNGPDEILNFVIKFKVAIKFLFALTKASLQQLEDYIRKKGNSNGPQNLRPISLLSNLNKSFEKVWNVGWVGIVISKILFLITSLGSWINNKNYISSRPNVRINSSTYTKFKKTTWIPYGWKEWISHPDE